MFTRIFGKPKQEANAVATLDRLNEVDQYSFLLFVRCIYTLSVCMFDVDYEFGRSKLFWPFILSICFALLYFEVLLMLCCSCQIQFAYEF